MLGEAIGTRALGDAGKRTLATEQTGPRPAGVGPNAAWVESPETRTMRPTRP